MANQNVYIWLVIVLLIIAVFILYLLVAVFNKDQFKTKYNIVDLSISTGIDNTYNLDQDSTLIVMNPNINSNVTITDTNNVTTIGLVYLFRNTSTYSVVLKPGANVTFISGNAPVVGVEESTLVSGFLSSATLINTIPVPGGGSVKLILYKFVDGFANLLQI